MKPLPVFVHGAAVNMSWADASRSLEELIFDGVTAALSASGVSIQDVDSVVLASHDLIDGRSLSSMVAAPAAGAYLRDEIRLAEDGLAALSLAAARVASGESRLSIVAAWGRASEGDAANVDTASMDPAMEKAFGMTEAGLSSMRFSRWMGDHGARQGDRDRAAKVRSERASLNPRAMGLEAPLMPLPWPLAAIDSPRRGDIVVATLVGSASAPVRLAGIGHGTDATMPGDRDWLARPALSAAVAQALREAGCSLKDIDLFEIEGMTLADEALAIEALGLAQPGRGFEAYATLDHINASGGSAAGWCYPAMGLVRFAECLFRLGQGKRRAMAVGASPIGAQTHTAAVVEAA